MAKQFTMDILAKNGSDKLSVVETDVLAAPGPSEIVIAIGDTVPEHRALEIMNGWEFLYEGIRDRGLLDDQFSGAILISGASVDSLTENNRRTSSTIGDFNDDDVLVGVGLNVATEGGLGRSATVMIDAGFRQLREYANENFFNKN